MYLNYDYGHKRFISETDFLLKLVTGQLYKILFSSLRKKIIKHERCEISRYKEALCMYVCM